MMSLSIKIITFNRAAKLRRTLEALTASPFRECSIEILDNASTDDTPAVVEEFREVLTNLTSVRHRYNIGVCANMLRAYERFETEYCWMLGDDDSYDFSAAEAVIQRLRAKQDDIVIVGVVLPFAESIGGFTGTTQDLQERGARLYQTLSFFPAMIFRRSFLEEKILFRCNRAASALWPHGPILEKVIEGKTIVFISERPIVVHNPPTDFGGVRPLGLCDIAEAAWYIDSTHRKRFFEDMLEIRSLSRTALLRRWATEKCSNSANVWRVWRFFSLYQYSPRYINVAIVLLLLIPRSFLTVLQRKVGKSPRSRVVIPHEVNERL